MTHTARNGRAARHSRSPMQPGYSGLALLCLALPVLAWPTARPGQGARQVAFIDAGGRSACAWVSRNRAAEIVKPGERLDQRFRAVWWHCEAPQLPAEMLTSERIDGIRRFVSEGGGLLLSGSALGYLPVLGVETAKPRFLPAGNDQIAAGLKPVPPCRAHPLFAGFSTDACVVTSGGLPATADFYGSGGPKEGVALARAGPDEGESPIVEYALGKGRILAIGWRLPDYGRSTNRFAGNLDRLTRNGLAYLEGHRWFDLATVRAWRSRPLYIGLVPNSHGTICGWLIPFSAERRKVIEQLRGHLACLRKEPSYRFALSEVPNIMSARELLSPEEWKQLVNEIQRGRIELVNSFYLEPDVNLADGEALCQMAIQGVRWQREVMGRTPSTCWMIDAVGMHPQMVQIVKKSGIDRIVFTRGNRTDSPLFRWRSPDGSEVLAAQWPAYGWFGNSAQPGIAFDANANSEKALKSLDETRQAVSDSLADAALLPIGQGDYSPPPSKPGLLPEALGRWNAGNPAQRIEMTTPSAFFRRVEGDRALASRLPVYSGELEYSWLAFNVNMPFVKQRFREIEHLLTAAEKAATIANLYGMEYPAQPLHRAWIDLLLNMDRNTIWGAAIQDVFVGSKEWNATDRFDDAERIARRVMADSLQYVGRKCRPSAGKPIMLFNSLSWARSGLQEVEVASGVSGLEDDKGRTISTQTLSTNGRTTRLLAKLEMPALGYRVIRATGRNVAEQGSTQYGGPVRTPFYTLTLNPATGGIASLRDRVGRELLADESNILIEQTGADEHFPKPREQRLNRATSGETRPSRISVQRGSLATIIRVEGQLDRLSPLTREITLYDDSPRIDFRTIIDWRGSDRIISVHFQLPRTGKMVHGVPYGQIAREDGSYPTVGWCEIATPYGGMALLDRGIPNREVAGGDAALLLLNSLPKYMGHPCEALAANGVQKFEYALLPHSGDASAGAVPQAYWSYIEPIRTAAVRPAGKLPPTAEFLKTSPNVLVTALRREGDHQVARLVNLSPNALSNSESILKIGYAQRGMADTNLLGEAVAATKGTKELRPQEIRTVSIRAGSGNALVKPITRFSELTEKPTGVAAR